MSALLRVTLRQLEYFVAVVSHRTMAAAAASCLVSQSAVSLAVADLERALGVQLFLRHRRKGLTLTAAGQQVVADARRLLGQAEELQSNARNLGQDLAGRLVIGCYPTLSPYIMPITLENFAGVHRGVEIEFVEGSVAQMHEWLLDGTCELSLMYDIGIQPTLSVTTLYRIKPHIELPADHRFADRHTVRLADLAEEPMIMLDMPPSAGYFRSVVADAGITPHITRRSGTVETVRALVSSGAGFSVLLQRPASLMSYSGQRFVVCEIEEEIGSVAVQAAVPASARPTRRAQAFIAFCRAYFADLGTSTPGAH
jgi:DNA-binding transcriptional LysR family regulator